MTCRSSEDDFNESFSDVEILEICGQVGREEYAQEELSKLAKHIILKPRYHGKRHYNINVNKRRKRQWGDNKRNKTEKKVTLPSLRNRDRKKIKVVTKSFIDKLFENI